MVVTSPFTVKSTRSQIAMQRVAPELKKIQQKYKGDRVTLNEEMMKLYKQHGINPASGCVPLLLQLPVFVVLYGVIRGLTNKVHEFGKTGPLIAHPDYISHNTRLYRDLVAGDGHMKAFGLDLTNTPFSHESHWYVAIPYVAIVLVAIALQYLQMRQLNSRNPSMAQANPQMQMMQRYMPLVFAFIYIRISAGVNIYFVVSSLCRIGIQEAIFRSGMLDKPPPSRRGSLPTAGGGGRRSFMERIADAQQRAIEQQKARQAGIQAELDKAPGPTTPGTAKPGTAKPGTAKPGTAKPGTAKHPPAKQPPQPPGDQAKQGGSGSTDRGSSGAKPPGAKAPGTKTPGTKSPAPNRAGTPPRPGTAAPANSKQNGSTRAAPPANSNGGPSANGAEDKAQPQAQGQSRSAKKRPRKAR